MPTGDALTVLNHVRQTALRKWITEGFPHANTFKVHLQLKLHLLF